MGMSDTVAMSVQFSNSSRASCRTPREFLDSRLLIVDAEEYTLSTRLVAHRNLHHVIRSRVVAPTTCIFQNCLTGTRITQTWVEIHFSAHILPLLSRTYEVQLPHCLQHAPILVRGDQLMLISFGPGKLA
jgi:hypothetical protein